MVIQFASIRIDMVISNPPLIRWMTILIFFKTSIDNALEIVNPTMLNAVEMPRE